MRISSFQSFMYAPETSGSSILFAGKTKSRYIRKRITAREFPHFRYSPVYVTASNNLKPSLQPMNGCNVFSLCSGDYSVVWIQIGILIHLKCIIENECLSRPLHISFSMWAYYFVCHRKKPTEFFCSISFGGRYSVFIHRCCV